ncbi:23S rRNA (uracil(1939)-C(5))-methyltransferase RlmD [Anaerobium acetethylicum]|uniref:23S rRNA (Uracil1939-C5)-methyltransferase n=1 Tax=Anaerobium acetethylicum TaxID=1619234 RepID=A0A1D3TX45_9FIRM|nr:23S rRNA (uracil(1939)-C(5))-methyltransferase RlmD [Anaerobium acetethylicum]SCP98886.1 23S rRNA (uracil1939-C5)-methyltransferase [Anaerobium acetethylicum]
MEFKKNEIVKIEILDMGSDGEGIGKIDGYPLFVKDAVTGDEIEARVTKAKKNYGYGRLMKILKPSPHRVEPKCAVAAQCGGCQIQALDYAEQLKYKENKVRNHLQRIGGFEDITVLPIIGMEEPYHYRNKAQFPVGTDKDGNIITGFYAGRTHSIISNTDCCLGAPVNEEILKKILAFMNENHVKPYNEENGEGLVRHILIRYGFTTKEIMVCVVINGRRLPSAEKLVESLCEIPGMTSISININKKATNVILGTEVVNLWGSDTITDYIGDVKYQISPLSFYQINPVQTRKLYETALDYAGLTGNETVWDLYCGIGTISLFLAKKAKQVYGVEIVPEAIADAKSNAKLNGISNAEFYVGKAEEVLPEKYKNENIHADVIVVDPPRKGCEESLLETIVQMNPARVVYVSCDSATLARDLKYLCERGYGIEKVQPVDMFPMTVHVETVVLLSKKP